MAWPIYEAVLGGGGRGEEKKKVVLMEQHTFKNVNNCLNTNIYSYLETSGGQSFNPY